MVWATLRAKNPGRSQTLRQMRKRDASKLTGETLSLLQRNTHKKIHSENACGKLMLDAPLPSAREKRQTARI